MEIKTNTDYKRLVSVMSNKLEIVGFVIYKGVKCGARIFTDRYLYKLLHHDKDGNELGFWAESPEDFIKYCEEYKVEFLDPYLSGSIVADIPRISGGLNETKPKRNKLFNCNAWGVSNNTHRRFP